MRLPWQGSPARLQSKSGTTGIDIILKVIQPDFSPFLLSAKVTTGEVAGRSGYSGAEKRESPQGVNRGGSSRVRGDLWGEILRDVQIGSVRRFPTPVADPHLTGGSWTMRDRGEQGVVRGRGVTGQGGIPRGV